MELQVQRLGALRREAMWQKRKMLAGLAVVAVIIANGMSQRPGRIVVAQGSGGKVPVFEVDPSWPKLPNNWVTGHVSSVAVDRHDNVWLLQRPNTIPEGNRAHA